MMTEAEATILAVLANDVAHIKSDIAEIKLNMLNSYVTRVEFEPVKKVVYGLVTIVLIAVVGALVALVIVG